MDVLVVDGANVVGSRPDGWWRDRAGAARRLRDRLVAADLTEGGLADEVVLVIEGAARAGCPPGRQGRVRTVHAAGSGDDAIVDEVQAAAGQDQGADVVVVTADRALRQRVEAAGAGTRGPGWLLARL